MTDKLTTPTTPDKPTTPTTPTSTIVLAGTGIALGSILLFGLLWFGLGQLDVANAARLIVAICTPPALMTVAVLWLWVTRRPAA